ncbi:MAG: NADPH:quinone oxidoreductase family protein [Cyclobacteriaceae bacterium]
MKAILCEAFGPPENLSLGEVPALSDPSPDEVIISVKAAGVNFPDTLIVQGLYQFQPDMPFSPGGEVAGVIKAVGANVSGFKAGDRVIAGTGWGGFANEVRAMASNTFLLPEKIAFSTGAVIAEAYGTSYHALVDRAHLKTDETLMVLGAAGGVGIAAVQIGKALGARVIAAVSSDDKGELCLQNGADEVINYSRGDLKKSAKDLTGGNGVDVIYDPVGEPYTEPALRAIAWNGRYLIVGFAAGKIPKIPMNLPLLKGCSIVGVFWGGFFRKEPQKNRQNFEALLNMVGEGRINPPIHATYQLAEAGRALREIMDRKVMGKLVLEVS